jgi:hypothetical protein
MKLFKKITGAVVAIALVLTTIFTVSAFKAKVPVVYAYTSNSHLETDIKDIGNWEVAAPESPACDQEGSLVCRYEFDGDMNDFQDFLELPSTTATAINSNAIAVKN